MLFRSPPLKTTTNSPGETPEVPQDPCQHWRGMLRFRHRLHTRSYTPASTGGECREAPSNSHGDWPFLKPPERVPEVPIVSREDLLQLENIQEVLPSRRDEAHFHCGVSRLITPNLWNFQRVLHTLAATQEVPRHTGLHTRRSIRVPHTSRGAQIPDRKSVV